MSSSQKGQKICSPMGREIVKQARRAGWHIRKIKCGLMLYPLNGQPPFPVHSSDRTGRRGTPNMVLQARKGGLDV